MSAFDPTIEPDDVERRLRSWMANQRAGVDQTSTYARIVEQTGSSRPRPRFLVRPSLTRTSPPTQWSYRWGRVAPIAVAALLLGLAIAAGVLVGSRLKSTEPSIAVLYDGIYPPFEYRPVSGVPTDRPFIGDEVVAFSIGATDIDPTLSDGMVLPGSHGIAIASVFNSAVVKSCPLANTARPRRLDASAWAYSTPPDDSSRFRVNGDPAGMVDDLRRFIGVESARAISYDGRAAIQVEVNPMNGGCITDLHVITGEVVHGLGQPVRDYIPIGMPSRLIVTAIGARTVVLEAWAATPDELDAWLPTATRFLDGIHFIGD